MVDFFESLSLKTYGSELSPLPTPTWQGRLLFDFFEIVRIFLFCKNDYGST